MNVKEKQKNFAIIAGQKAISIYQKLSLNRLPSCRYVPSCSEYAYEAITTYGFIRGTWYGTKRICRCHPWGGYGYDPIPSREK